jgi:hypothetical protein
LLAEVLGLELLQELRNKPAANTETKRDRDPFRGFIINFNRVIIERLC